MHMIFNKNILILLFSLLAFASCENSIEELQRVKAMNEPGIETAENVEVLYSDSAVVRVNIKAPKMTYKNTLDNPERIFSGGVKMNFFDALRQPTSYLVAESATRYESTGKVVLRKGVKIWNMKNERLETEELVWDELSEKAYSKAFVKIFQGDEVLMGYDLVSNMDFSEWELKRVSGIVKASELGAAQ